MIRRPTAPRSQHSVVSAASSKGTTVHRRRGSSLAASNAKAGGARSLRRVRRAKAETNHRTAAARRRLGQRTPKKRTRVGIRPFSRRLQYQQQPNVELEVLNLPLENSTDMREASYQEGYEKGRYEGGELLLERATPAQMLLPDVSLQEVINGGIEMLRSRCYPLLRMLEVYEQMEQAIQLQQPCSVISLGDGELLTLSCLGYHQSR